MNFGETLAYWYLRFNGFFPLSNWVLHGLRGTPDHHTADCDLLAIRFPHVYEDIGGRDYDWDSARFEAWGLGFGHTLGLIVEVRTGSDPSKYHLDRSFHARRVKHAVQRFGFWERGIAQQVADSLEINATVHKSGITVAKLSITASEPDCDPSLCLRLKLDKAKEFLLRRIANYNEKHMDRMFFTDNLMQYLAWKG